MIINMKLRSISDEINQPNHEPLVGLLIMFLPLLMILSAVRMSIEWNYMETGSLFNYLIRFHERQNGKQNLHCCNYLAELSCRVVW